jgi:hypothetical protein
VPTASTNEILVKLDDGEMRERRGVAYAEDVVRDEDNQAGVAVQYMRQPEHKEPQTEFIEDASLVGVYDEICDDYLANEYRNLVEIDP